MGRRRQPRTEAKLEVKLWGTDASGKAFIDPVHTRNVSAEGALLEGVQRNLKPGDAVGITYRDQKARFRVAWVGVADTSEAGLLGVETISHGKCIWDVPLQTGADLFVHTRGSERRQFARFECQASIEIRTSSSLAPIRGRLVDISLGGCYAEMQVPLKVGTTLDLIIWLDQTKLRTAALVTSSHPGFGIGVKFIAMGKSERHQLEEHLAKEASRKKDTAARLGISTTPGTQTSALGPRLPETLKSRS